MLHIKDKIFCPPLFTGSSPPRRLKRSLNMWTGWMWMCFRGARVFSPVSVCFANYIGVGSSSVQSSFYSSVQCRIAADTMRRGSPYNYNAVRAVFNFACNLEFMTINRYRYRCCSSLKSLWRTSLFPVLAGCLWGHAWDYTLISSLSSISH